MPVESEQNSVATNDTDRRRFLLATALTLIALPALWWANQQSESGAPNVATAGIDVGNGSDSGTVPADPVIGQTVVVEPNTTTPPAITEVTTTAPADPSAPIFLEGPRGAVGGGGAQIATPAAPTVAHISTSATYRSTISPSSTCLASSVETGTVITVVNLNNGRSVTCVATRVYSADDTGLVLFTDTFAQIADLTDAPIPVEISQ